ncbi:MAG TPA: hypothetical protein VM489_09885 [Burkholderiales bacterium]|nr:hypothetical protein [Burkholderiales bacterium]
MTTVELTLEPLRVFLRQMGDFLPRLAAALLIVLIGWFLARAARYAVVRLLRAVNFHVVTERSGVDAFLRDGGLRIDTAEILGLTVYWLVLLGALVVGFNSLGLAYVTDLLVQVVLFVPRVILAVLILAFGAYFARFVGQALAAWCRSLHVQDAELLGRLAQYAILTFVVLIALDQMGIGGDIVRQSFLVVLAGLVLALALAFGLAGKDWAADLLERWWPRKRP